MIEQVNPEQPASSDIEGRMQISKHVHLWLDEPADWSRKVRRLRLSGWCVARRGEPLNAIRATLRGRVFCGHFDRERAEVAAHLHLPEAPRWCGFTVDVRVPVGKARLNVQVARADGNGSKLSRATFAGHFGSARQNANIGRPRMWRIGLVTSPFSSIAQERTIGRPLGVTSTLPGGASEKRSK